MRPVIILFAKAPAPGRVKTRLVPPLTPERAAALHAALVADAIEHFQGLLPQLRNADLELHTDLPTGAWSFSGVAQALQCEGDLGLKMFQALRHALDGGRERAIIAGGDAPALPADFVRALLDAEEDVALGPTADGGYYAISCRRVHPKMFDGVPWSTGLALEGTIAAARACGLTTALGPPWFDVDTADDLERLKTVPGLGPRTARMIL